MSHTPNTPANGGQILTWQERMEAYYASGNVRALPTEHFKDLEIVDLRAALAAPAIQTVDRNAVPVAQDLFDGDDAALCDSIHALLAMDQAGILVPHGVGGHARTLLATAALRLADGVAQPAAQGAVIGMHEAADFIDRRAQKYLDENADTEFDTGAVVFHCGEAGRDYYSTLVELAEELRAAPSEQSTDKTAEGL